MINLYLCAQTINNTMKPTFIIIYPFFICLWDFAGCCIGYCICA